MTDSDVFERGVARRQKMFGPNGTKPLENAEVMGAIANAVQRLNGTGRLLVRASGTEPLIRIMAEGDDEKLVSQVVKEIAPDCDVVIQDLKASRRHCQLTRKESGFLLEDLGSRNGTLVNGTKITQPMLLKVNQTFQIGDTMFYLT